MVLCTEIIGFQQCGFIIQKSGMTERERERESERDIVRYIYIRRESEIDDVQY